VPGGVSDYTQILAGKLADAGDEVHVWTPQIDAAREPSGNKITIHELPGRFTPKALGILGRALKEEKRPHRVLVQYVPHSYGMRGMNLPFALWLKSNCPTLPWVYFHEVAFPANKHQPFRHKLLSRAQHTMARWIARSMARGFVSVPRWAQYLSEVAPGTKACEWLPVPSNVATQADAGRVAAIRGRLLSGGVDRIVGHFGTYGEDIAGDIAQTFASLLTKDSRSGILLVGRGSTEFAERLVRENREFGQRVHATGSLNPGAVAEHLLAADVLYQPYLDGISSRRTSAMAGLALGVPIVTFRGEATEPIWIEERIVRLVNAGDSDAACAALIECAENNIERGEMSERARKIYEKHFSWAVVVDRLRQD
jgi:glycosyltransferase involved in cell wall biosynthesis